MFTQQHYQWLANWARTAALAVSDMDRNLVVSSLADHLSRDNERFDRVKFIEACRRWEDKP